MGRNVQIYQSEEKGCPFVIATTKTVIGVMRELHGFDVGTLHWCRHTEEYEEVEEDVLTETIRVYENDAYEDTRTITYENDAYEYNNEDQMMGAAKLSASAAMASKSTMSASVNMSTVTTTQSSNSRISSSSSSSDTEKYKRPLGPGRY